MKIFKIFFVLFVGFTLLFSPVIGLSQSLNELPNPGLTPDSFWYFGEIIKERIEIIFTFKKTEKVEKYITFSEERISEINDMKEKRKYREGAVACDELLSLVDRAKGTVNVLNEGQLDSIRNDVNQETSLQIYYLKKITGSTTDSVLKPKLQEAKLEMNRLRQLVRE